MTILEMLAVAQQLQTVLVLENPVLVMKVDVDFTAVDNRYLTLMAGMWNGNEYYKYRMEIFREGMRADKVFKLVRDFRSEVEKWEAE